MPRLPEVMAAVTAIPDVIRRPWQLLRQYVVSTSLAHGVDAQLGDLDWRSLYQVLPKHVRQSIAKQSMEEVCSYILFRECKMDGKDDKLKWPGCDPGDGAIDDVETFLSVRQWCHGLLVDFDLELALHSEMEDTLSMRGSLGLKACLTPAMFGHVVSLKDKVSELFQPAAVLSCLSDSAAPATQSVQKDQKDSHDSPAPAIKKLKTEALDVRSAGPDAAVATPADDAWCRDFAASLLRPWPFSSVKAGQKMHFGTMVHLLVRAFEGMLGSTWPTKVILVDAGNVQRLGLPQLQAQASHLVAAVSTPHHWGLLCARRGSTETVLFDGLRDADLRNEALAFVKYLDDAWPEAESYTVTQDESMVQEDAWSCGHRAVLAAREVIRMRDGAWPPACSSGAVTTLAVHELCRMTQTCSSSSSGILGPGEAPAPSAPSGPSAPSTPTRRPKREPPLDSPVDQKNKKYQKPCPNVLTQDAEAEAEVARSAEDDNAYEDVKAEMEDVERHEALDHAEDMLVSALASRKKGKVAKPQRATKQTGAGARQRGLEVWRHSKLDFNSDYQKLHAQRKDSYEGREHWQKFLEALASDKPVKCESCRLLREKVLRGGCEPSAISAVADVADPAAVADSTEAAPSIPIQDIQDQQAGAAGHQHRAGQKRSGLQTWVDENRNGQYMQKGKSNWFCKVCNVEVNTYGRNGGSASQYIIKHEQQKGPKVRHAAYASKDQPEACPGVALGSSDSQLDRFESSCKRWVMGGCLRTRKEEDQDGKSSKKATSKQKQEPHILDQCTFSWQGDTLRMTSSQCGGRKEFGRACSNCLRLANLKALHQEIGFWAMRMDLAEFAKVLCFGLEEECTSFKERIAGSDYMSFQKVRLEVEEVLSLDNRPNMVACIKRKLLGIGYKYRTERLHIFLETHLQNLPCGEIAMEEKRVYKGLATTLCNSLVNGNVSAEDLNLAAKVATGKLNSSRAVAALFHSVVSMQERVDRGLTRVCKAADEATLAELYWTFGNNAGAKHMLKQFGVNPTNDTPVCSPGFLPRSYAAHRDKYRLDTNLKTVLEQLMVTGTRDYFVGIDETTWRATYDAVSGFLGPL